MHSLSRQGGLPSGGRKGAASAAAALVAGGHPPPEGPPSAPCDPPAAQVGAAGAAGITLQVKQKGGVCLQVMPWEEWRQTHLAGGSRMSSKAA